MTAARDALLAAPLGDHGMTRVAGIESRGFLPGAAAAPCGVSLVVDQPGPAARGALGRVTSLAGATALGDPEA